MAKKRKAKPQPDPWVITPMDFIHLDDHTLIIDRRKIALSMAGIEKIGGSEHIAKNDIEADGRILIWVSFPASMDPDEIIATIKSEQKK